MKRIFAPFLSLDDPRCKHPVPHSLEILNDAVLYVSGEVEKAPNKYPFSPKLSRTDIETIVSRSLLDRLLYHWDNNATRNYLVASIEYCLLSSPQSISAFNRDGDLESDAKRDHEPGATPGAAAVDTAPTSTQPAQAADVDTLGLVHNLSFIRSFVAEFLSQWKRATLITWVRSNDVLMIILLRLLDVVLAGSQDDKQKQHRMQQLPCADKLMEKLCAMCNQVVRHQARSMLLSLLRAHEFLIDPLLKLCRARLDKRFGMIRMLLVMLTDKKHPRSLALFGDKFKSEFSALILSDIITAKSPPSMTVREAFGPFFKCVRVPEFRDTFLDEILRMMKRNPASTTATCSVIFAWIKHVGNGEIHAQFAPLLMEELKHGEDAARQQMAVATFERYAAHVVDVVDLQLLIKLLRKETSQPTISTAQRQLFMRCLACLHVNCIDVLSNDAYSQLAVSLLDALISILNKESHTAVRDQICELIAQIVGTLKRLKLAVPASVHDLLLACLEGRTYGNRSVPATVKMLVQTLEDSRANNVAFLRAISASKKVWQFLNECIASANQNPVQNGQDGLAALLAMVYICAEDDTLFAAHKSRILDILNESKLKSFFNYAAFVWHDAWQVALLRVQIIEKMLLKSGSFYLTQYRVTDDAMHFKGVWDCLLYSTLHHDFRVRRFACRVIRGVNGMNLQFPVSKKRTQSFSCLMVTLLQRYVADLLTGNAVYMHPEKVKTGELSLHDDIPLPIAFGDALRAMAGSVPRADAVVYILYLAHFPWFNVQSVRAAKQQHSKLWLEIVDAWSDKSAHKKLVSKNKKKLQRKRNVAHRQQLQQQQQQEEKYADAEEDAADSYSAKSRKIQNLLVHTLHHNKQFEDLVRTDLTRIKYPIAQTAIMDALACVFKLSPKLVTENERILSVVAQALNSAHDVLDFTEKEKRICCTPEGQLCTFDDEHKSRSEAEKARHEKKQKQQQQNKKVTNLGAVAKVKTKKGGKASKKVIQTDDTLLVKTVTEKGTHRVLTEEEEIAEERKLQALRSGAAEKEKQALIEQQSLVRKKLETVRFRLHSVFTLFAAFTAINASDFARYLSATYLQRLLPLARSELLEADVCHGVQVILQSFSAPIRKQSQGIATLLIKHHLFGHKMLENATVRSKIVDTFKQLMEDSKIPDIRVEFGNFAKRRRNDKSKSVAAAASASASASGRGRGRGRGAVAAAPGVPGVTPGRGRGRGVPGMRGRGRGVVAGRGRGRGRGMPPPTMVTPGAVGRGRGVAVSAAVGRGRGRGRGRGAMISASDAADAKNDQEDDEDEEDVDEERDLFVESYDTSQRWSVASFAALFPVMQTCLTQLVDPKRNNKFKFKVNRLFPNWLLSMIVHHCHDDLNLVDLMVPTTTKTSSSTGAVRFPSYDVSLVLLQSISFYPFCYKAIKYGLRALSPSMREKAENIPSPMADNQEPPVSKAEQMKLELDASEMRAILNREGCLAPNGKVRMAALSALAANQCVLYPQSDLVASRLLVLSHDVDAEEAIARTAMRIWRQRECALSESLLERVIGCVGNPGAEVRMSIAVALGAFCSCGRELKQTAYRQKAVHRLIAEYKSHKDELVTVQKDNVARTTKISKWTFRHGVSLSLSKIAHLRDLEKAYVMSILDFLLKYGLSEPDQNVYKQNLESGRSLFEAHGAAHSTEFFVKLDQIYHKIEHERTQKSDWIRQGNIIFTACLVEQIAYDASDAATNARIENIMERLLDTMQTPSLDVQFAICDSLQHLIARENVKSKAQTYANKLLHLCTTHKDFPARRGAAMGLAALIKGLKIPSVSSLGVMEFLANAVNSKQQWIARHGALLAYKELFAKLGTAFEPFVTKVLPHLLTRFGDENQEVRRATALASKTVMSILSNFGIKMVLPMVLVALDKNDWRTKVQSAQMLGQMAYCAPKVLATYLPQIIPKLNRVLQDPKKEVSNAATAALKNIGSVVRNPEIASLVPLLLESMTKGGEHTKKALHALIHTSFTNVVDVPSLALVIPILCNAMSDRSSTTKKMAAQVIGGVCSLIAEPKSIVPYLGELLRGIKSILTDPIPEVRSASALAIRSLNESLSDDSGGGGGGQEAAQHMRGVYEWLMTLLDDETTNNVQRFGAAQGLSELVASYHSDDKMAQVLPLILRGLDSDKAVVRESYSQVFVYLPKALAADFPYWMEQIVPPLLQLLGDDSEPVRSCCLRALKIMVYMFHASEYDLMLELLEDGLDCDDWRVRESTLELIGDLLNGLAGNQGSVSYETNATSHTETHILEHLGLQRRNEVFSLLYMARSDGEQPVRQRANITWKGLVYNSSRMLKQILDTLMHALITSLSSKNRERQQAASKSLGDLVKHAAQFILPKIVPILKRGLSTAASQSADSAESAAYKEGIALGLAQVLENAHPKLLEGYEAELVECIALGVCDALLRVRNASGTALKVAVRVFGKRCVDVIVPRLVRLRHIAGLQQLLQCPPNVCQALILPFLMRELLVEAQELEAFSLLARDINDWCHAYLHKFIADLFRSLCEIVAQADSPPQQLPFAHKIVVDVVSPECTHLLLTTCLDYVTQGRSAVADDRKLVALSLLSAFVQHTGNDFAENVPQIIRGLLELFNDANVDIQVAAWNTLNVAMATQEEAVLATHIDWFRQCVRAASDNYGRERIDAFCLKQGLKPVMRMFDYGIRNGSFEQRVDAAKLMMDLIRLSSVDAVKPFLNKIAGALIRICADRFPAHVKCPLLQTLTLLIDKYGDLMKGFYTPLQTTFVKAMHDASSAVRDDSSVAILALMRFSPKFDNLLRDLNNYLKKQSAEMEEGISLSILTTMSRVLRLPLVAAHVKAAIVGDIHATLSLSDEFRTHKEDALRLSASQCAAAVIHCMHSDEEREQCMVSLLDVDEDEDDWRSIEYDLNALAFVVADARVYTAALHASYHADVQRTFEAFLDAQQVLLRIAALRVGYAFVRRMANFEDAASHTQVVAAVLDKHLLPLLSAKVNNSNRDIVVSSAEFLLDCMYLDEEDGDAQQDEKLDHETETQKQKQKRINPIWRTLDIQQVVLPYLIENHSNNIEQQMMRKCIVALFGIDKSRDVMSESALKSYHTFIQNCNQKSVVKELAAIVEALKQT